METFDVFLSHNRVDKPWVSQLAADLQRYGVRVWLDQKVLRPGDRCVQGLEEALAQSRVVALVVSPESMASDWVREEYDRAIAQQKRLIPVLIRDAPLWEFLDSRHRVDFRDPRTYDANVRQLVRGITEAEPPASLHLPAPTTAAPGTQGMCTGGVRAGGNIQARTIVTGAQVHGADADTVGALTDLTQDMQSGAVEAGQDINASDIITGVQSVPDSDPEAEMARLRAEIQRRRGSA